MRALLTCASVAAIAFGLSTPAMAQDNTGTASEDDGLGMIVVTAQKRSENIQDVPIAISAVGSEFLESRGIDSIDKLGTIDLRVDYLRPALGERFEAQARVIRLGSRLANTQMEFFAANGQLLATGSGAYIIS